MFGRWGPDGLDAASTRPQVAPPRAAGFAASWRCVIRHLVRSARYRGQGADVAESRSQPGGKVWRARR